MYRGSTYRHMQHRSERLSVQRGGKAHSQLAAAATGRKQRADGGGQREDAVAIVGDRGLVWCLLLAAAVELQDHAGALAQLSSRDSHGVVRPPRSRTQNKRHVPAGKQATFDQLLSD